MAVKKTKATKPKVIKPGPQNDKPQLVRCGRAYVSPSEVAAIDKVRQDLWIVKLKSEPNPEYPMWLHENGFAEFAQHFELLAGSNLLEDELGPPEVPPIKYR